MSWSTHFQFPGERIQQFFSLHPPNIDMIVYNFSETGISPLLEPPRYQFNWRMQDVVKSISRTGWSAAWQLKCEDTSDGTVDHSDTINTFRAVFLWHEVVRQWPSYSVLSPHTGFAFSQISKTSFAAKSFPSHSWTSNGHLSCSTMPNGEMVVNSN